MKNLILILFISLTFKHLNAQVSVITDQFSTNLTKKDLNFSGDRKLFAIAVNDQHTKNYIVVSKNKRGAKNDILSIDKFTKKKGKIFEKTFTTQFTHKTNLSIAFVQDKMMYKDIDKDGHMEFMYIVKKNKDGMNSPLTKVIGLIVYKNKAYNLWIDASDNFKTTHFSKKFKELPEHISTEFINFWDSIRKK